MSEIVEAVPLPVADRGGATKLNSKVVRGPPARGETSSGTGRGGVVPEPDVAGPDVADPEVADRDASEPGVLELRLAVDRAGLELEPPHPPTSAATAATSSPTCAWRLIAAAKSKGRPVPAHRIR